MNKQKPGQERLFLIEDHSLIVFKTMKILMTVYSKVAVTGVTICGANKKDFCTLDHD